MADSIINILGIEIPFVSRFFLGVVGLHIIVALVAVFVGAASIVSKKVRGRHPTYGKIYFWSMAVVFASATILSAMRWAQTYHLFLLGVLSFAAAIVGRRSLKHWTKGLKYHIVGMSASYILMLTAFYVDNGKNLPLWKELPAITYWLLPSAIGIPLIIWALRRHRQG